MKYFFLAYIALFSNCTSSKMTTVSTSNPEEAISKGDDVFIQDKTIAADLDFTKLVAHNLISEGVMQGKVGSSVTFSRCIFKGKISGFSTTDKGVLCTTIFGRNLSFLNCTFEKEVTFRGASVEGRTDFTGSTFNANANFEELTCKDNAFFSKTVFEGEARFQNAFFNKKANFMEASFAKAVNFQSAFFNWEALFNVIKMKEYADFSLVTFANDAFFNYAECKKRFVMEGVTARGRFDMMNSQLNEANLSNANFTGQCRFNEAQIGTQLNFSNSRFAQKPETDALPAAKLNQAGMKIQQ
jgi:uncharacterized protein YjbI with pentapeptide repeats